uniref:Uncharacterized protein n=1 Tax=Rhizophora mucronata TaxID=61149 RepID=A0A2P2IZ56_RHIMU
MEGSLAWTGVVGPLTVAGLVTVLGLGFVGATSRDLSTTIWIADYFR